MVHQGLDLDDDGHPKRTGTVWTATAHIVTFVIGADVLFSLSWNMAQLGWIVAPCMIFSFSCFSIYVSLLLVECYRSGDPATGRRNHTYMDAVRSYLGGTKGMVCGLIQYSSLFTYAIQQTLDASQSMAAIKKSNCIQENGSKDSCEVSSNLYKIIFAVAQIIFSQIPDFDQIWWLSIISTVATFTYTSMGIGLLIARVVGNQRLKGSLTGVSSGKQVTRAQKTWGSFVSLGNIASAYSYTIILFEIQDTLKSPPSEAKTMKKANRYSTAIMTLLYLLCGCIGYAAFGDESQGDLLTDLGFSKPFWVLDIVNAAIVVQVVGTYRVLSQPLFAFVEKRAHEKWPENKFINKNIKVPIRGFNSHNLNLFHFVWRSMFVVLTTFISMLFDPFFESGSAIVYICSFCLLSVYFPIEMYIAKEKVPSWSTKWIFLHTLSLASLIIAAIYTVGLIPYVVLDMKGYKPFQGNN